MMFFLFLNRNNNLSMKCIILFTFYKYQINIFLKLPGWLKSEFSSGYTDKSGL